MALSDSSAATAARLAIIRQVADAEVTYIMRGDLVRSLMRDWAVFRRKTLRRAAAAAANGRGLEADLLRFEESSKHKEVRKAMRGYFEAERAWKESEEARARLPTAYLG